ncbi:hypothetical protein JY97_07765 [Alkalispirochaeta odontotermitis]|nr:hypothetical protein JY97_07765 [Alkalispirochaeta odontotermitis]CAB1079114.1 Adenylate cyclase (EC [Olavius algarvensis Delta 1 endosymbiont]
MDAFMDMLWFKILIGVQHLKNLVDIIVSPLNALGPAVAIFAIAFAAVLVTKFLTKIIKTKRYQQLRQDFEYWFNLRQDALKCEDSEKGKQLAKNIDRAQLNKAYYDYFFEGFMLSLATKFLPILVLLAYVNEAYQPANLLQLFGQDYIFKFGGDGAGATPVGAAFWYVISLLLIYICWAVVKKRFTKSAAPRKSPHPIGSGA